MGQGDLVCVLLSQHSAGTPSGSPPFHHAADSVLAGNELHLGPQVATGSSKKSPLLDFTTFI